MPGSAAASTPTQPASAQNATSARRAAPPPRPPGPRARRRSRRSRRAGCRRAAARSATIAVADDVLVERADEHRRVVAVEQRGERVARAARAAPRASTTARRRARRAARRGTRARARRRARGRRRSRPRASSTSRLRGDLVDLAENRAAVAVRAFVGAHGVELVGREAGEPLDDLRRRQRVVARDRQRVARPARRRSVGRRGAGAGAAPFVCARARRRAAGPASGVRRRCAVRRRRRRRSCRGTTAPAARALSTSRSTRWRTIGTPNATATWPMLFAVVVRCCTCAWRRSISARPRATNMFTNVGPMSLRYRPTPIGAYTSTSSVCSMRSLCSLMRCLLTSAGRGRTFRTSGCSTDWLVRRSATSL